MTINKHNIIIIGNGIIGNSICYALQKLDPNLKIAVLGETERPGAATIAAGAMLNCFAELTSLSLKTQAGQAKFDLARESLNIWPSWIETINNDLGCSNNTLSLRAGTFVIHNTKSGKLDTVHYKAIIDALKKYNEPFEYVDPQAIEGLDPVDDARSLEALYLPNEGSINPQNVLMAFEEIFLLNQNVNLINDIAIDISHKKNLFSIETKKGNILYSEKVILAAGAYCQVLIDKLPDIVRKIPRIFAGAGFSFTIEQNKFNPIKHVIRTPNRSGACGLHALPTTDGNLYIGASNNVYTAPQELPSAGLAHFLLECALEQINQELYKSRVHKWHTGNRPASLDTYPLIGETSIPGLWLISGTYRDGFHMSPLIAQDIANKILNQSGLIQHNIFAPERKLLHMLTKEESVTEAIEHYMSGAYERAMKLPKAGWDPLFRTMFSERLNKLFEELNIEFGLTPDMLLMFEFADNREALIKEFKNYSTYH
jgi:glycine/D-amino acid oxidase-like deaminating enzyme